MVAICHPDELKPLPIQEANLERALDAMSWVESSPGMQAGKTPVNGHDPEEDGAQYPRPPAERKKIVVVGLGMVGIAFM